jgi:single-strand DNA-binding protein
MANGFNQVILFGNLGADPELRMTNGGNAVLKLRLATSESYLDRNKVRQERTEWHSVIVWGRRAEALAKLLSKGSKVFVQGSVRTTSWEDQESGQKKYRTEINANEIILAGSRPGGRSDADDGQRWSGGGDDDLPPETYTGGDDIPF